MMIAVTSLAVLLSGNASAAPPACVSPAPRTVPTKVLNIFNNSSIPIYVVLEAAKQNLLDANGQPYD